MNPATLIYVIQVLEAIPTLIAAGQSVSLLISQTTANLKAMQAENREPTAQEWMEQAQIISELRAQLHAPN